MNSKNVSFFSFNIKKIVVRDEPREETIQMSATWSFFASGVHACPAEMSLFSFCFQRKEDQIQTVEDCFFFVFSKIRHCLIGIHTLISRDFVFIFFSRFLLHSIEGRFLDE